MIKRLSVILLLFISVQTFSQNLDVRILNTINTSQTQSADKFFKFASNSNNAVIVGIPLGMGIAGLINHDEKLFNNACFIVEASAVNVALTYALKYSINRERPFDKYSYILKKSDGGGPSFPSGHTSGAFATATSLSMAYPKWYIIVPSFAWAGTVAYSRMYLGVHYPSDVLGGMITGAGSAYLSNKLNKWINKHYNKKYVQY
ncbi:MAG: phosphatase PAP2 family protein [Bacteroidota bacterium]|nr:phosphatase PAP2 family protein [Bacteroidota bacterium]MDP4204626.1 phosphatase PAP2 family protein [Bacteroidota bacterium]